MPCNVMLREQIQRYGITVQTRQNDIMTAMSAVIP